MTRKTRTTLLLLTGTLVLLTALAACASLKLPGAQPSSGAQQTPGMNFANQPIESKLAMGTLKLEGTANAITTQQAKDLLPLWKAVKSMSASTTTSQQEMAALYKQIQETMTTGQVQAIKDMQLKPDDYQALMKQYNIQPPQGGDFGSLSESERATRVAQFRSQNGGNGSGNSGRRNNNNGGGFPGGGMPPDGGGFPGGGQTGQSTPRAPQGSRGFRGGGMNNVFIDPLIKLLQEKAK